MRATAQHLAEATLSAVHMEALDHGTTSRQDLRDAAKSSGLVEHSSSSPQMMKQLG